LNRGGEGKNGYRNCGELEELKQGSRGGGDSYAGRKAPQTTAEIHLNKRKKPYTKFMSKMSRRKQKGERGRGCYSGKEKGSIAEKGAQTKKKIFNETKNRSSGNLRGNELGLRAGTSRRKRVREKNAWELGASLQAQRKRTPKRESIKERPIKNGENQLTRKTTVRREEVQGKGKKPEELFETSIGLWRGNGSLEEKKKKHFKKASKRIEGKESPGGV